MTDKLLLFAAFVFVMLLMSFNYTKKKKKIIFFGDSVAEQGIKAGGYISIIQSIINREGLDDKYALVGADTQSNDVYNWYTRFEKEVLSQGVDVVVLFFGMNNVLRNASMADNTEAKQVEHFYREIVHKLTSVNIKTIICTPVFIDDDNGNSVDDLYTHTELVRALAQENNLKLVDLRTAFLNNDLETRELELTSANSQFTNRGNELVAEEMWKAIKDIQLIKG